MLERISNTNSVNPKLIPQLKVESLISRTNNQAIITFTYFKDGISVDCINSALYNSFDKRGIQIPANQQKEFGGLSSVKIDHSQFPRAFFKFMYPSNRFSEKDYTHTMQFGN